LTLRLTCCKLKITSWFGCPPHPSQFVFYDNGYICDLTHKFAALANLCFRNRYFANGTAYRIVYFDLNPELFCPISAAQTV
jgi:hypothetical protein